MIIAILVFALFMALMYMFGAWIEGNECPRQIYGYPCKGSDVCDHSEGAVAQAKWDMDRQ